MKQILFQTLSYIHYLLHARHRHGFGVHSPFAFRLITNVIENKYPYYIYKEVESQREKLKKSPIEIRVTDFGTHPSGKRKVRDIVRKAVKSSKHAQLIFRLALEQNPTTVVELGTSVGLTSSYLSKSCPKGELHTFEGSESLIMIAKEVLESCRVGRNTFFHIGNIDQTLQEYLSTSKPIDVAFLDANHTEEATLRYFDLLLDHASESALFIIDDIHFSPGMRHAWEKIKQEERVQVTFDLFSMGLVYVNPELQKQDYVLFF